MTSAPSLHALLNASAARHPDREAVHEPGAGTVTYRELGSLADRVRDSLLGIGIRPGDRVGVYLPKSIDAVAAIFGILKAGAAYVPIDPGSPPWRAAYILSDCAVAALIVERTLWDAVQAELAQAGSRARVLVVDAVGGGRGLAAALDEAGPPPAGPRRYRDPGLDSLAYLLYTSGSTGKPKGVLHSSGGYLLWASLTHELVFDYRPGQVYWCAADIGWVTGHSYIVYGPLANGGTTLMFEGVPNWPDASRIWQVVDRHQVEILYTAPTALRALMREGDAFVAKTSRRSLRLLGTVGEPINPEAWRWYYDVVGEGRCPIVDTWWQTETGGHMITPLPGATPLKPGSATRPFPGVDPQIVDGEGTILHGATEGNLVIARSWPGQMRTVWGDHARFFQTYFTTYRGKYFTGDGCRRDQDGYYWITGRVDDVINVSGHRMGTAEVESALVLHPKVAEAAVVGMPHDIKGQGIYAYVTLNANCAADDALRAELIKWVRTEIGPIAAPDALQFAPGLPKTRSGKIMRRILRKIAEGDVSSLGDTSTLADPSVVDDLVRNRVG